MAAVSVTVNSNQDMVATGKITVASTAAAVDVNIGFIPTYVKCFNASSGGLVMIEWWYGMTSGHSKKTAANGTITMITSLGITAKDVDDTYLGFNIGLDTDLLASDEIVYFYALG